MAWTYYSNYSDTRVLKLTITETVNKSSNSSTLNWTFESVGGNDTWYSIAPTTITINGKQVYYKAFTAWTSHEFPAAKGSVSGSLDVKHNEDGTKTGVSVSFKTYVEFSSTASEWANASINLTKIDVYTLSVSAGTGSSVTVNRTSSGYASTGNITNGAKLYYGDKLKITFTPSTNYAIQTHNVNGAAFTSGNTHTVTGNVSVAATAIQLKSEIGATDANIGSTSTITVVRYNSAYTHTITYLFGTLSGTIVTKGTQTSIPWTIPESFYSQIPNAKYGTGSLTIETFNGSGTSLGTNSCTFKATASQGECAPTITATVVDTNDSTKSLTGDDSVLVRYVSDATCTLTATPKNYATISSNKINGSTVTGTSSGESVVSTKNFASVSGNDFTFETTDSRGYSKSVTVSTTIINYVRLTLNPIINRPSPTGDTIELTFTGDYFRGSFGEYNNTLSIRYRYREKSEPLYESWNSISSSDITYGVDNYRTSSPITLSNFNYQNSYDFQIQAYDGANGVALSTVTQDLDIRRGIPIFDWGENDFEFHVPTNFGAGINIDESVTFNNGNQPGERKIVFKNTSANEGEYPHEAALYGGSPFSSYAIGLYDTKNSIPILRYRDTTNEVDIGNTSTTLNIKGGYTYRLPTIGVDLDTVKTSGSYYVGSSSANRPGTINGYLNVHAFSDGTYAEQEYRDYRGNEYFRVLQNNVWGNWIRTGGCVELWTGSLVMNAGESASLSEPVSRQNSGIVLLWSYINQDYNFGAFFIPKSYVTSFAGKGIAMFGAGNGYIAGPWAKYVYINDSSISGNAGNVSVKAANNTDNGLQNDNTKYVLRKVFGV